jgi:hypothetical protein
MWHAGLGTLPRSMLSGFRIKSGMTAGYAAAGGVSVLPVDRSGVNHV